jgi:hypothetical protein
MVDRGIPCDNRPTTKKKKTAKKKKGAKKKK